jgi:hypothetical protein
MCFSKPMIKAVFKRAFCLYQTCKEFEGTKNTTLKECVDFIFKAYADPL